MAYRVDVMPRAIDDLTEYADLIQRSSPIQAKKWLQGAWDAIFSLAEMPERYEIIAEAELLGSEIRDVGYFSHRIVYEVDRENRVVNVLRVYPMSQEPISPQSIS